MKIGTSYFQSSHSFRHMFEIVLGISHIKFRMKMGWSSSSSFYFFLDKVVGSAVTSNGTLFWMISKNSEWGCFFNMSSC